MSYLTKYMRKLDEPRVRNKRPDPNFLKKPEDWTTIVEGEYGAHYGRIKYTIIDDELIASGIATTCTIRDLCGRKGTVFGSLEDVEREIKLVPYMVDRGCSYAVNRYLFMECVGIDKRRDFLGSFQTAKISKLNAVMQNRLCSYVEFMLEVGNVHPFCVGSSTLGGRIVGNKQSVIYMIIAELPDDVSCYFRFKYCVYIGYGTCQRKYREPNAKNKTPSGRTYEHETRTYEFVDWFLRRCRNSVKFVLKIFETENEGADEEVKLIQQMMQVKGLLVLNINIAKASGANVWNGIESDKYFRKVSNSTGKGIDLAMKGLKKFVDGDLHETNKKASVNWSISVDYSTVNEFKFKRIDFNGDLDGYWMYDRKERSIKLFKDKRKKKLKCILTPTPSYGYFLEYTLIRLVRALKKLGFVQWEIESIFERSGVDMIIPNVALANFHAHEVKSMFLKGDVQGLWRKIRSGEFWLMFIPVKNGSYIHFSFGSKNGKYLTFGLDIQIYPGYYLLRKIIPEKKEFYISRYYPQNNGFGQLIKINKKLSFTDEFFKILR